MPSTNDTSDLALSLWAKQVESLQDLQRIHEGQPFLEDVFNGGTHCYYEAFCILVD